MSSVPDYYRILGVAPDASSDEIKKAYQRESLRSHPDRFPKASATEKKEYTRRFQSVADAYYILSDPVRRRDYDDAYRTSASGTSSGSAGDDEESANFFQSFFGTNGTKGEHTRPEPGQQFAETWEDLLRPEVERTGHMWQWTGTAAGSVLGYIIGNVPGALGGGLLGSKVGSIRDAKGKAVSEVFLHLRSDQRAQILRELAMKVLGSL